MMDSKKWSSFEVSQYLNDFFMRVFVQARDTAAAKAAAVVNSGLNPNLVKKNERAAAARDAFPELVKKIVRLVR